MNNLTATSAPDAVTSLVLDFIRAEDAEDRYAFRLGAQQYVLRGAEGGVENVELQWNQALLADLATLHQPGCDPAVIQRVGRTLRNFLKSDDWARQEARLMAAVPRGQPVFVTIRSAAAELYALPWELLTLGASGQHLGELPSVLVRYEWPETRTTAESPSPRPEGGRVLFAWSAAGGHVPVAEHLRAIQEGARAGHHPFDSKGDVLEHATYGHLDDVLKQAAAPGGTPISVLHLLCHGGAAGQTCGLVLDSEGGDTPTVIDAGRLRQLLAPYVGMVRLVVIAACNSGNIGTLGNQLGSVSQALHQLGIATVIASRFPLSIPGANRFSHTFYRELLGGPSSVETAFLAARRQLARDVGQLDWASMQLYARDADGHDSRPLVLRPYRGLLAFEPSHSRFYVGRNTLRSELKQRILEAAEGKRPRFQVIAGASGSGKSSLAMAGVAPSLPGELWTYRVMRPGDMAVLSDLERLSTERPEGRFLLVVDQFEEVFTHLSPEARERQLQRLWTLAQREGSNVVVIATLRVDFLDRCGEVGLGGGLRLDTVVYDEAHRLFIPQLEPGEYPEIITEPAHRVGLQFEEGLVERIMADLGEEPGALPLLQYALDLLWQQRSGGRLTHEAYERITRARGIAGALTATMDALYEGMAPEEQAQARRILVSLVDFREDSSLYTRRRVELAVVRPSAEAAQRLFDRVLERLVQSRFVVRGSTDASLEKAGAETLEVAHEALIRRWERLTQWIHEDREKELQLRQIHDWTQEWTAHQKDPGSLLRGTRLGYALNLRERYANELPEETTRFIEESRRRDERRRRNARLRLLLTVGFTAAAALVMTYFYSNAEQQRKRAKGIAITAVSQTLQSNPTLVTALLKEVEPPRSDSWMQVALDTVQHPVAETVLKGHTSFISKVLFSPDGTRVLTVSDDTARLQNIDGRGKPIPFQGHSEWITDAAFNSDGTRLITGSVDKSARVWDVKNPDQARVLPHPEEVIAVTFGSNAEEAITITFDGLIRVWSLTRNDPSPATLGSGIPRVVHATFNAARTLACIVDPKGVARLWRLDGRGAPSPTELKIPGKNILVAGFHPDGEHLITGSDDGSAQLWWMKADGASLVWERQIFPPESTDSRIREAVFSPNGTHVLLITVYHASILPATGQGDPISVGEDVITADFSPDSAWVLIGNHNGSAQVRRVGSQGEHHILKGGCIKAIRVAFSQDGSRAAIGCHDGTARIWNISLLHGLSHQERAAWIAFTPKGSHALTASLDDQNIRLWRVDAPGKLTLIRSLGQPARLDLSPDEEHLLVVDKADGHLARLESINGKGETITLDNQSPIRHTAFSFKKSRVALTDPEGNVRVWRIGEPPELLKTLPGKLSKEHEPFSIAASFSPDGERLLTSSGLGTVRIWHIDSTSKVDLPHDWQVMSAQFSANGDYVLTVAVDSNYRNKARVWHSSRAEVFRELGEVDAASFSTDGKRILGYSDRGIHVWNTERSENPRVLPSSAPPIKYAAFGPDDASVISITQDGARLWRLDHTGDPLVLRDKANITAFTLSPDGKSGVTLSEDGTIRSWALSEERLLQHLQQVSTLCPSTRQRERYMGEREQEAQSHCEACEEKYDRPVESCAFE
jgi:WD40 repeat protein